VWEWWPPKRTPADNPHGASLGQRGDLADQVPAGQDLRSRCSEMPTIARWSSRCGAAQFSARFNRAPGTTPRRQIARSATPRGLGGATTSNTTRSRPRTRPGLTTSSHSSSCRSAALRSRLTQDWKSATGSRGRCSEGVHNSFRAAPAPVALTHGPALRPGNALTDPNLRKRPTGAASASGTKHAERLLCAAPNGQPAGAPYVGGLRPTSSSGPGAQCRTRPLLGRERVIPGHVLRTVAQGLFQRWGSTSVDARLAAIASSCPTVPPDRSEITKVLLTEIPELQATSCSRAAARHVGRT